MIVFTDGVFDLFHYGHINLFVNCRKFGDKLYVGVVSDECVLYKRQTILDLDERYKLVESCKYVDKVIKNSPSPLTKEFLIENKIDLVIRGNDNLEIEYINKWYKIPYDMGILKFVSYTRTISTTNIIKRIENNLDLKYVNKLLIENDITSYNNITPVSNAKTNSVYFINYKNEKCVLRLFNNNPKLLFDRIFENNIINKLYEFNLSPKIIYDFKIGRIDEFINSINLDDPIKYQKEISLNIKKIHNFNIKNDGPIFWEKFNYYLQKSEYKYNDKINIVINKIKSYNNNYWNEIVLGHGDLNLENILITKDGLKFIDFEYSCFMPRGFDIANHICEYHGYIPTEVHYPEKNIRVSFIENYLESKCNEIDLEIIDLYSLIAHYFWACWAFISYNLYDDIDYKNYCKNYFEIRFKQFIKYFEIFIK